MRRVVLRTLEIQEGAGRPVELDYAGWCRQVLVQSNGRGFSFEEMVARLPVVNAIDAAIAASAGEVLLEEAEHKMLVQAFKAHRFPGVSPALVEMVREIEAAPKTEREQAAAL